MQILHASVVTSADKTPPELKIDLLCADSIGQSYTAPQVSGSGTGAQTAGTWCFRPIMSSLGASPSSADCYLHTLSNNWPPNTQFAFEATFASSSASYTASLALIDLTTGSRGVVSASTISATIAQMSTYRSGTFALIPGHVYGITGWTNNVSGNCTLCDAKLIAFPN